MPMMKVFTPRYFFIASIPFLIESVRSSIVRVSEVMYGSHSAALMITYLKTERSFVTNFTKVGKPAPPSPTEPLFFTASMKLSRS